MSKIYVKEILSEEDINAILSIGFKNSYANVFYKDYGDDGDGKNFGVILNPASKNGTLVISYFNDSDYESYEAICNIGEIYNDTSMLLALGVVHIECN
jgi:hypothetical protein